MHYPTLHFPTVLFYTMYFPTMHFPAMLFPTMHFPTMYFPTMHYTTMHFPTIHFPTIQFPTMLFYTMHFLTMYFPTMIQFLVDKLKSNVRMLLGGCTSHPIQCTGALLPGPPYSMHWGSIAGYSPFNALGLCCRCQPNQCSGNMSCYLMCQFPLKNCMIGCNSALKFHKFLYF